MLQTELVLKSDETHDQLPNKDLIVGRFGLLLFFFNSAAKPKKKVFKRISAMLKILPYPLLGKSSATNILEM
jgi:hypothetical protein